MWCQRYIQKSLFFVSVLIIKLNFSGFTQLYLYNKLGSAYNFSNYSPALVALSNVNYSNFKVYCQIHAKSDLIKQKLGKY